MSSQWETRADICMKKLQSSHWDYASLELIRKLTELMMHILLSMLSMASATKRTQNIAVSFKKFKIRRR